MVQAFTHLAGAAGMVLLLANFAPEALSRPLAALWTQPASEGLAADGADIANRARKGDRLTARRSVARAVPVASIELVGPSQTTVILRDRLGQVAYQSDAETGTTLVARDADVPSVTAAEAAQAGILPRRAMPAAQSQEGEPDKARRGLRSGCEGIVSALADQELRRVPSLCLVSAGGGPAS